VVSRGGGAMCVCKCVSQQLAAARHHRRFELSSVEVAAVAAGGSNADASDGTLTGADGEECGGQDGAQHRRKKA